MSEKGSWSHKPEDLLSPCVGDSCKEQKRETSDNRSMSDHYFKSSNLDSTGGELCADDTILGDKCLMEDDTVSQYSISHISQPDNELSFLDNDGWLDFGNFEDIDRTMLNCDLTFGMGSLNNEEEFCWLSSSHGTEGSDDALKSDFKFSSAEASPFKSISDNNINPNENIEGLTIHDCSRKASPINKNLKSQMNVDHDAVPASLSMFSESDMTFGVEDGLVHKPKIERKLSKPSTGKRKNGYLNNGDSDHPSTHVEQYANLKQSFGDSSSGVTSQDSIHKRRPSTDSESLGCIQIQTPLMNAEYSHTHTSKYTSLLPPFSVSRSEHDGHPSPSFKDPSYASNMDISHGHPLEAAALKTNDNSRNPCLFHDTELLSGGFKSENIQSSTPFKSPGPAQKVGHRFEDENEGHSEVGGTSIGFSQEIESSNVQENSSMSPALDKVSHQTNSFCQLQQIMDQLDIKTKLCIRDSLYRLAKSAEPRHNDTNASGQMGDDVDMAQDANSYGSFFGPSQPVIAQRVLQEKKSLSENQHLASRISNPLHTKKNQNKVSNGGSKSSSHNPPPKVSEVKGKSQKLKDTRDYSFLLSDDAELPAPSKAPPPRDMSIQNSEGRPAQVPLRSKQPSSNGGRLFHVSHEDRKQGSVAGHLPHKSGSTYRPSSTSKPGTTSADSRKQLGNNSGNGPGRPVGPKGLPPKIPVRNTGNKSSTPGIKNPVNGVHKSVPSKAHSSIPKKSVVPSKAHSSIPKQSVEQRRDTREPNKPKMIPKQPVASSKSQISKPLKQIPMHSASQNHRPKNKVPRQHLDDVEPEMDYRRMIRSMYHYNPENCADDDDDDNMEAGFEEIMREERRSAKIARREDEEQLRLIEEEEKRMRRKRLAKNR